MTRKSIFNQGDKERAIAKAETLYDEGIQCLIDFDHSYHIFNKTCITK